MYSPLSCLKLNTCKPGNPKEGPARQTSKWSVHMNAHWVLLPVPANQDTQDGTAYHTQDMR